MIIVGAKGFATEVLEILHQQNKLNQLVFYDDISKESPQKLFAKYIVLKTIEEASEYFKNVDNRFTIGIGKPILRKKLAEKFINIGGEFISVVSPRASIGHFNTKIGIGCNIMTGAIITNEVAIGIGNLINLNSTIGHNSTIGEFVEISPGVTISGNCSIGSYTFIGSNATILPKISIGSNVIVAAGAVVTKNFGNNCLIMGIPAKVVRELDPLEFLE